MSEAVPLQEDSGRQYTEAEGFWARRVGKISTYIYWGIHASCLLVFVVGVTTGDLVLFATTLFVRIFAITGGYHRYFAHKTYKTSRPFQFFLAFLGTTATQKGPLWWAGHHRTHHKYADRPGRDTHSPKDGLWYAHQGWIFDPRTEATPMGNIPDFARYPELVFLNRWYVLGPILLAIGCYWIGGLSGLLWGFAVSQVCLWHLTYCVNSIAHIWGTRRYDTPDTSRNNPILGLLTLGEGWHNNHHHYCTSARNGFFWYEIDITYYILRGFAALGLIWDLREVPEHILRPEAKLKNAA